MRKQSLYARKRARGQTTEAKIGSALFLLDQARPFDDGETDDINKDHRAAFERLRTGTGTPLDYNNLVMKFTIFNVRSEEISPVLTSTMKLGLSAMQRMHDRHAKGLTLAFDADGLRDVPFALGACEDILAASSPLQMKLAIKEGWRRATGDSTLEIPQCPI